LRTASRFCSLPVTVERVELERLERDVSSAFTRVTTVVHLAGGGEEGLGEDVTYDAGEHDRFPEVDLAGEHTLASLSARLDGLPDYRRWAFESAALDLALRQAGRSLHEVLGREPRPVTFVVSMRLGEPATSAPLRAVLDAYPGMRFKLDPTRSWTPALVEELVGLDCVDQVDLKGAYRGTVVDNPPDPALYRLVAEGFPHAWIEDPALVPETEAVLAPHRGRVTWDAPIHSVADVEALSFPPRALNCKPSRFGSLERLLDFYDYAAEHGIALYGGGQFELGVGRGQIQLLASLFHPDAPNDVAPGGYNDPRPGPGLPRSPLPVEPAATGFQQLSTAAVETP
jgi:L-alanine-DL-glutamate epimerase-like enolase superfamily enzyme